MTDIPSEPMDMRLTLTWKELKDRLLSALMGQTDLSEQARLLVFVSQHWSAHAPRQFEVAALEQKIRMLEKEVAHRGDAIKLLNARIKEWQRAYDNTQGPHS